MDGLSDFEKLLYESIENIKKDVSDIKADLAALKVRTGLLGLLGGAIAAGAIKAVSCFGWWKNG